MSDSSSEQSTKIASPISIGLLNADSAFLLDEKYYLDEGDQEDNDNESGGLVKLVESLGAISREEITTGSLNLFFKSHRKGIPHNTRETIRVVLPTLKSFSKDTQRLTDQLLLQTAKRNKIINQEFHPLKIGTTTVSECFVFQKDLLSQLSQLLEIYHQIYKSLTLLAQIDEDQEEVIMYAFFHLKKATYQTELERDIIEIEKNFTRAFQILGKIHGFIGRLKKRINELEKKIIPETKTIEMRTIDDF